MVPKITLELISSELNNTPIGFVGFSRRKGTIYAIYIDRSGYLQWKPIPPDNVDQPFNLRVLKKDEEDA